MIPQLPLLDLIDSEEGAGLRRIFHEKRLESGSLLRAPNGEDQVFIVRSGRIRVYFATPEQELSLGYLTATDMFSTHSRALLQATQATELLVARRDVLERQLGRYPALQATIVRVLAMVLSQAMTLIEDLAFHPVKRRIARYLLRSAARHKIPVAVDSLILVELSMEEIAALLGTTRQTASTELNAMIHAGGIARQGRRHIRICDPERLYLWAGADHPAGI
ncbi:Crp/Fnr family transcriptional regulator [Gluconacetobacter azotocaptans]|uniref:Crp/Fnr family transcriptional regulator n=1 Tax=Gluconacetobacter azotocaptans TaxID=142834 RepID=A0A7W4JVT1_9PROT|nr:Crp/Fnr family transcriptional regulator [Gluconacetobacter azotocaptans]MBB2191824.1 Crp/Fnr family transcriptional regulator [Gluconacetobacter azotocaptans]GBQ28225.1 Crp/FNR family transcriptional regulator [Gluconacetobacter azotocaptans DSM 13594]